MSAVKSFQQHREHRNPQIKNFRLFVWSCARIIITLGLVVQAALVQANMEGKQNQQRNVSVEAIDTFAWKEMTIVRDKNHRAYISNHRYQIDLSGILSSFDKVEESFRKLISMFNQQESNHLRKTRDTNVLGTQAKCTVSKQKLVGLKSRITDILTNVNDTQNAIPCELDFGNSTDCNMLIKFFLCSIEHFKKDLEDANAKETSLNIITSLNKVNDDLLLNFNRVFEDVRLSASEESRHEMDELKTKLQNLSHQLNIKADKLKKSVQELCVAEIHSGRISEAYAYFVELDDSSKLIWIIEESYNRLSNADAYASYSSKKLENVDNILKFIWRLRDAQEVQAYKILFDSMEKNEHLDAIEVLDFDKQVGESKEYTFTQKEQLDNVRISLLPHVFKSVQKWAIEKDYEKIREYALASQVTKENIDGFLPMIVNTLYTSLSSFDPVLKFIYSLPTWESHGLGYEALLSEMEVLNHIYGHSEIMKLAWRAHQTMPGQTDHEKQIFKFLKQNLPGIVRDLMQSSMKCLIQNDKFSEYFHADFYVLYDRWRRDVFTRRGGDRSEDFYWQISTSDQGKSFEFYSLRFREYFYAANDEHAFDSDRRRVFTWTAGNPIAQGDWKLEPMTSNTFRIYNTYHNEYLYAANDEHAQDYARRRVFTWRPGNSVNQGYWKFICR